MPMNFLPRGHTAFDASTGITISHPRIYPEIHANGTVTAEYEYTIRKNEEIIDGLVIQGTETTTEENGKRKYTYTLEIVGKNTIGRLLTLKQRIANQDSHFDFISSIAQGAVNVFVNNKDSNFELRNLAITTREKLAENGVTIPSYAQTSPDGTIILAESHTPANSIHGTQS